MTLGRSGSLAEPNLLAQGVGTTPLPEEGEEADGMHACTCSHTHNAHRQTGHTPTHVVEGPQ